MTRTFAERKKDTLARLENDVDAWVATAGPDGAGPCMVPLSFLWEEETLLISTAEAAPTARNLLADDRVRVGVGLTRDVVLIQGTAQALRPRDLPEATGDAFAVKTGFDPRSLSSPYLYFRIRPVWVRAWREEDELAGRVLMREGRWLG
ncbi:pyridoxamine 5'-phosphate oxidase family protein [Nonomuraea sp. MCN248]|uniref:Pyridoxamine 5'-phosphate oxidase family protein n=1 Tax=Nonomuraea corallina TaxID=2989783 RepID=A0ABT4SNF8_9ACTN|nr:pyridoxamine 5'-phosphate oxidase family protein [Nonomuraea corallina]MDA0638783.1 pyridoxamine 5'-phosphate oxidase family protein [Nonomuraea corallina]